MLHKLPLALTVPVVMLFLRLPLGLLGCDPCMSELDTDLLKFGQLGADLQFERFGQLGPDFTKPRPGGRRGEPGPALSGSEGSEEEAR